MLLNLGNNFGLTYKTTV